MSATFPNLKQVASWLGAELYVTLERPIKIKEYIKVSHGVGQGVYLVEQSKTGES